MFKITIKKYGEIFSGHKYTYIIHHVEHEMNATPPQNCYIQSEHPDSRKGINNAKLFIWINKRKAHVLFERTHWLKKQIENNCLCVMLKTRMAVHIILTLNGNMCICGIIVWLTRFFCCGIISGPVSCAPDFNTRKIKIRGWFASCNREKAFTVRPRTVPPPERQVPRKLIPPATLISFSCIKTFL